MILNLKSVNSNENQSFNFKRKITKGVDYITNASKTALKNININIPAKSTVGIIGATGCGKTTTVI